MITKIIKKYKGKYMNQYQKIILALIITFFVGCSSENNDYIASGTFEATEVMVSSEGVGKILSLNITEGSIIKKGEIVGIIDTTQLYLKKLQILASADAVKSRKPDIEKQIAVTEQQIANFEIEKNRIENLMKSNAVPKKQLDDVNAQIALLKKQLVALKSNLDISTRGLNEESNAIAIQIKQIDDQISKCYIKSPINGTVLIKYAEEGEIAMQGKPLFKMADIENMYLRAYIISSQLADIKIGQNVKVVSDYGSNKIKEYSGTVSWISSKAEFTPKTILTKDERANLVYATKIAVKNDGFLKIGMYGKLKK
jgi:HlyD family secretion protein